MTVACGDLDFPFLVSRSRELAARLPHALYQVLPGMAHQPYLEQPGTVAQLVAQALAQSDLPRTDSAGIFSWLRAQQGCRSRPHGPLSASRMGLPRTTGRRSG